MRALAQARNDPTKRKNFFCRAFDAVYQPLENAYARLISRMVHHSGVMTLLAAVLVVGSIWGLARTPTAFIPTEDQGYMMVVVTSRRRLARPHAGSDGQLSTAIEKVPASHTRLHRRHLAHRQQRRPRECRHRLCDARAWAERGKAESLLPMYDSLNKAVAAVQASNNLVLVPPPITGLGPLRWIPDADQPHRRHVQTTRNSRTPPTPSPPRREKIPACAWRSRPSAPSCRSFRST